MKHLAAIITAFIASSALGPAAFATSFPGDYTFQFVGTCSDCSGQVTATLKLTDYTLGDGLLPSNLVSFSYGGSNLLPAYTISANPYYNWDNVNGGIDPDDGYVEVRLNDWTTNFFTSYSDGSWYTGDHTSTGGNNLLDYGTGGSWTLASGPAAAVPEPASWMTMLFGFGAIGSVMRRQRMSVGFA